MTRPRWEGKRSLMRTTTLLPVAVKVTFTRVPKAKLTWAAVRASWSKGSPLEVRFPSKPGPYHEATPSWTKPRGGRTLGGKRNGRAQEGRVRPANRMARARR